MLDTLGNDAVQAIDRLIADRPEKVGQDFSEATRRLTAWREQLIERWRQTQAERDKGNLERVNAAISVVVGGQFPLGSVPWPHIKRVRNDLAALAGADGD
jgi:hypothetical protein